MVSWILPDVMTKDALMSRKIGFLNDFRAEVLALGKVRIS